MSRNYVIEMRAIVDQEATGEYVSATIAAQIVEKLTLTDPDLLTGWLTAQAPALIRAAINERDRSRRTHARTAHPRSVFHDAAEQHEEGDSAPLAGLLQTHYVVDATDLRKPLGDMNADDLCFVSSDYYRRSQTLALESAFFAALARKVGSGTVADHFTEDQLHEMRRSLRA